MNNLFQRISRRTLVPALAVGLAIGAIGMATSAAHAETNTTGTTDTSQVRCEYGGEKFSVGAKKQVGTDRHGNPIFQVCQKNGTWKFEVPPPSRFPVAPIGGGAVLAP